MNELIVKLAGAGILLTAAAVYGRQGAREEKRRLRELEALWELVRFIRVNIRRFARPLPEIFADFESETLESAGFLPLLREKGMEDAVRECGIFRRDAQAQKIFGDLARSLGRGYRPEEENLCAYAEERLADLLGKRRQETSDREKLYRTIPVMLALSAALILL